MDIVTSILDFFALDAQTPIFRLAKFDAKMIESLARACFMAVCVGSAAWLWQTSPLSALEKKAAAATGIVHFFLSMLIDVAAVRCGVYKYILSQQLLWGIAVDLHLGWAALWGTGLCLVWPRVKPGHRFVLLPLLIATTLAVDFLALESGRIFVALRSEWWLWDLCALIFLSVFTLNYFRLIQRNKLLIVRAALYGFMYLVFFYVLFPALIVELGEKRAFDPRVILKPWSWIALALASIPGAYAAIQFALQADGTPLPLDPTRRLVTNGIYAHIRNPMQCSGMLAAIVWALTTNSFFMWTYVLDLALLFWSVKKFEEAEMNDRFGERYERYAGAVKKWIPRLTPYRENQQKVSDGSL